MNRDGAYFPELRRALAGDAEALSALYRLEAALAPAVATVERYGRVWAKDTDYYAAAEVLGINESPEDPNEGLGFDPIYGGCNTEPSQGAHGNG